MRMRAGGAAYALDTVASVASVARLLRQRGGGIERYGSAARCVSVCECVEPDNSAVRSIAVRNSRRICGGQTSETSPSHRDAN